MIARGLNGCLSQSFLSCAMPGRMGDPVRAPGAASGMTDKRGTS